MLGTEPIAVDGQWEPGLSASGTSGVQFAAVQVDIETGITRVEKIVCVQDCGLIVDLKTAETQCYGGIISGVNYAVYEERILDRNTALMVNANMETYLMAGQSDIPVIDVVLVDQPERGVIGIGEPPAVATAAAIANAVRNATGVTIRSIPITPELLAALDKSSPGRHAESLGRRSDRQCVGDVDRFVERPALRGDLDATLVDHDALRSRAARSAALGARESIRSTAFSRCSWRR